MNPYVLQVWLINADGSGLRKLAQLPGCCIVIRGDLHWSKDGSSIVLMADGQRRFDVATGRRLPMRSSKG
jgi:Tol biopolymer transport system component